METINHTQLGDKSYIVTGICEFEAKMGPAVLAADSEPRMHSCTTPAETERVYPDPYVEAGKGEPIKFCELHARIADVSSQSLVPQSKWTVTYWYYKGGQVYTKALMFYGCHSSGEYVFLDKAPGRGFVYPVTLWPRWIHKLHEGW